MDEHNPYESPRAAIVPAVHDTNLASRGSRLGASLIDGVIGMLAVGPLMYFSGYFAVIFAAADAGQQPPLATQFMWAAISFAVWVAIHLVPLKNGQTWGKKAVGIRIVTMGGAQPGLGVLLGRHVFSVAMHLIPFVGRFLTMADVLFIFRRDKRCLHDLVAGTQVVVAADR